MPRRRSRMVIRGIHLALGIALALLVYLPVTWTSGLRFALAAVGVPVIAATGVALWQRARIQRWTGSVWLPIAAVAAAGTAAGGQVLLQQTFATVRHVVPLGAVNSQPDPEVVRAWHARLIEQGTFDRMVATELVDLVWIAGLAAGVVTLTLLAAAVLRHRNPAIARRLRAVAPFTALAPALDLVENAVSLAMLADPLGFPAALAPVHAVVSTVKLVAIISTLVAVPGYAFLGALTGTGSWMPSEPERSHGETGKALPSRIA